ncbi:hypothetical protein RRG08_052820 [Elysia crispata]|uniref:Uncharacterized protein n=1 Tax=Elysia crispata TaxID=231223 RepID=A0AAE1B6G6_9GAST|nr:hypothetical protein RRG08_052820 [Elysia crispata]
MGMGRCDIDKACQTGTGRGLQPQPATQPGVTRGPLARAAESHAWPCSVLDTCRGCIDQLFMEGSVWLFMSKHLDESLCDLWTRLEQCGWKSQRQQSQGPVMQLPLGGSGSVGRNCFDSIWEPRQLL